MIDHKVKLTERQQAIYQFLKDKIINRGYGPTVREIGDAFDIRSPNGVMGHLKALERKGLIKRKSHISRSIQLCDNAQKPANIHLAGSLQAGAPIGTTMGDSQVDFSSLFESGDNFCLKVKGTSMIEAQIQDGDYVIVKKQDTCQQGEIVVALVDQQEATLKRFYQEADRVRLEPANSSMAPIYSNNVQILGVVKGVIRKFV
ncbi:transcriptional repressor LexA [Gimesia benthica]|uniref:LexA repressor n=1 Tax=Gimesia benthica TaxID=2608982 RepID=A0A6I6ABZ5_9PLAN|nr:transcriptional repressor LexA [Gimesia benthica]QGQ22581.1 transcriptional repressor LexA [Gimesia benthica]